MFTDQDPLFPATKNEQEGNDSYSFIAENIDKRFWKGTNGIRNIFKKRFEAAGLEYFTPHTLRHLAIKLALSLCRTPEEIKAVSQNFGHENIATTMFDYAALPDDEVENKIKNLTQKDEDSEIEEIVKTLSRKFKAVKK